MILPVLKSLFRFWNELRRRNVPKGIISYVIFSWVILQVISVLGSLVEIPPWTGKTALITLLILFPFWLAFSWFYDITPEGIKRTAAQTEEFDENRTAAVGRKLNIFIVVTLSIAVVLLLVDRFRLQKNNTNAATEYIASLKSENSIVVLPFRDLSPGQDQEYFADGLAEELLNSLTNISKLKVTSRTSAFSFKNKALDIPTIAQKLGVNYIVEGSIRKEDSVIRVTINLIDSKQDKGIWSRTWDRKITNIFEVQNSIAQAVAGNLLVDFRSNSVPRVPETDPEAYALYLEAKYWFQQDRQSETNLSKAQELITQSIDMDSTYAPSWVLRSTLYRTQSGMGYLPTEEGYTKSKEAAEKSVELDPNYASSYSALSNIILESEWDFQAADFYIQKALEMEPNNADIIDNAAGVALALGDIKQAVALNEQSVLVDPVNIDAQFNMGLGYYYNGQYEEAGKSIEKSLELQADQMTAHYVFSLIHLAQNELKKARMEIELEPFDGWQSQTLAMISWAEGDKAAARKHLEDMINAYPGEMDYQVAQVYGYWDEVDKAFLWLDKAYDTRNFGLVEMQHDPLLENLKGDPRWIPFLQKMNFPGF